MERPKEHLNWDINTLRYVEEVEYQNEELRKRLEELGDDDWLSQMSVFNPTLTVELDGVEYSISYFADKKLGNWIKRKGR